MNRTTSSRAARIVPFVVHACLCLQASTAGSESYTSSLGTIVSTTSGDHQVATGPMSWSASARYTGATPQELQQLLKDGCPAAQVTSCGVAALLFWVDGRLISQQEGPADATISVDTTALANGQHEFFVTAWSTGDPSRMIGAVQKVITVNNGRMPMEISSGWRELFLAPGQTRLLSPKLIYTTGETEALSQGLSFRIDPPNVATVDASGLVTALANGFGVLTMTAQGKSASSRILVSSASGLPHFGKDGRILSQYDPSYSLFLREVFGINPDELAADPRLGPAAKDAGINALNASIYSNPYDDHSPDLTAWTKDWDQTWATYVNSARSLGMSLFLVGDDIARDPTELNNSLTSSWSANAIQHAFSAAHDSGLGVAVDMIDEVSFLYGDTPTPTGGQWQSLSPPIPDNAFSRLMAIINASPSRIPISWPTGGISNTTAVANWMGNSAFSDYASHYWDVADFRDEYYYSGKSLKQIQHWMGDQALYGRQPFIQRDKPQISLISATGAFYTKEVAGDHFQEGRDLLLRAGDGPDRVMAQIMFAAIAGMSGVRVYDYDRTEWRNDRATLPTGTGELQTGFTIGSPVWNAISLSFNFIKQIEGLLLQPRVDAVDMGSNVETTARKGPGGTLLMALNLSEAPQAIIANLAPYQPNGSTIRYRLTTAGSNKDSTASTTTDNLTLQPGETVVWVITSGIASSLSGLSCTPSPLIIPGSATCTVTLSAPAPGSGTTVTLTSDNPAVSIPQSVTVPAGATTGTFTLTALSSSAVGSARLTASLAGTFTSFVLPLVFGPVITADGVVNGASLLIGPIAPGELITIFGSGIGPATGAGIHLTSAGLVDSTLANTRVLFDNVPAPLIFVRSDQINAVVPYDVGGRAFSQLQVEYQGIKSNPVSLPINDASPAIFTADSSGQGQGAIANADTTANSSLNPAKRGSIVVLYATGGGATNPPSINGQIPVDVLPKPLLPVSVRIGGLDADVVYAGAAPQLVSGVLQINVRVPDNATTGALPVTLTVGGKSSSRTVTVALQ